MAKSLRSKVKRRWRSLKRKVMDEAFTKPNCQKMNDNIKATVNGYEYRQPKKLNAFKNPDDPNAEFPQYVVPKVIDMRSAYIPFGGNEWVGARRKKVNDVQILVDNLNGQKDDQDTVEQIEDEIVAQNWNEDENDEIILAGQPEDVIQEEGVSKRSLLKKISKDKKVVRKPQRKSRNILKF